jgi:hypothetical protein
MRKTPFFLIHKVLKAKVHNFTDLNELFTHISELRCWAEDKSALNFLNGQKRPIEMRNNKEKMST